MIRLPLFALIALSATAGLADTTPISAENLHAALSGRHFDCTLGDMQWGMEFEEVAADKDRFPYAFTAGDHSSNDAYLGEGTRIILQSKGEERFVAFDADGALLISKTPDGMAATCAPRQ